MTRKPRVAFVGLDAMDVNIVRELVDRGELPTIRRLFDDAAWAPTINPPGLFVGGVWPSIATATWPDRHGFYCFRQLEERTYDIRRFGPWDIRTAPFWEALSDAGLRSCVVDVPISTVSQRIAGTQVVEWGTHDRIAPRGSHPPEALGEIVERFGDYPVDRCDSYTEQGELDRLRDDLVAGTDTKQRLAEHLLASGDWDLFLLVHGAAHCAGHHFWKVHDTTHPAHAPALLAQLGDDPLEVVYRALDDALGRLLAGFDAETTVVVLLSHGMGPHYDGDHLLAEILDRLDRAYGGSPASKVWTERLHRRRGRRARAAKRTVTVDGSRHFVKLPNNEFFGGMRINLAGREPRGIVKPNEVDALVERLRADFLALRDPDDGRPIVRAVLRTRDLYAEGDAIDALPDLLVDWERSLPINGAASPAIGEVRGVYDGVRTGDHRPGGVVFVRGAGVRPGPLDRSVPVVNLAPTISAMLGVTLDGVDGEPEPAFLAPADRAQQ